jgi:hypothetical protein
LTPGPAFEGLVLALIPLRWELVLLRAFILSALIASLPSAHAQHADGGDDLATGRRRARANPATLEACKPPANCDTTPVPRSDPRRRRFDRWIVEAANEFGVEPGLLKAQVHTETSFVALIENSGERSRLLENLDKTEAQASEWLKTKPDYYGWGKGLGQFGSSNARTYGLDWWAEKPTMELAMSEAYNKPQANGLYSVWSPKGGIFAKAKMLRQRLDDLGSIKVQKPDGAIVTKNLAAIYPVNDVESARYTVAMYNRGRRRVMNSMKEYYRREGRFPDWFAEAWAVQPDERTPANPTLLREPGSAEPPTFRLLNGELQSRCHVYRIAGLCGDEAQNYLKEYRRDFRSRSGVWELL